MQIPSTISRSTLQELAQPGETHAVRIIVHNVNNPTSYRMRRRNREYRFERDGTVGKHILDVPLSVWMHGASVAPFRETFTIADDFRNADAGNYTVHVIALPGAAAPTPTADPQPPAEDSDIPEMLDLLETLILRMADKFDPELTRANLTPHLQAAFNRSGQVAAEAFFKEYGRTEILEFQDKMWPDVSTSPPPTDLTTEETPGAKNDTEETPGERKARLMREGKARKAAERAAQSA